MRDRIYGFSAGKGFNLLSKVSTFSRRGGSLLSVILAFQMLRQEDHKLEASL